MSRLALALLVIFIPQVQAQQLPAPSITSEPSSPQLGQPLNLTCNVQNGTTVTRYRWLKDFNYVVGEEGKTLKFLSLANTDSGSYRCQYVGVNDTQSDVSNQFDISVGVPAKPVLDSSPRGPLVSADYYSLSLTCRSSSRNVQTYKFFKNGKQIGSQSFETFYLYNIDESSSGTFTCVAAGTAGESEPSDGLTLTFVKAPTITASNENPNIGDSLTLTCNTPVQENSIEFKWLRGYNVIDNANNQVYTIASVAETDNGTYTCAITLFVENEDFVFESRQSMPYFLIFSDPEAPELFVQQQKLNHSSWLTFSCRANYTARVGLEWAYLYFNGERIAQYNGTSGYADIQQLALYRNDGSYTCTFSNKRGESEHSQAVVIDVQTWTPAPRRVSSGDRIYPREESTYLSCEAISYSPGEIDYCTMYIDGMRYYEDTDCNFAVPHGITGNYTCTASNIENTSSMGPSGMSTFFEVQKNVELRELSHCMNMAELC